jgi:hypothetical protein
MMSIRKVHYYLKVNGEMVNHSALKDGASFVLANALALGRSSVTTPILYSATTINLTLL